MDREEGNFSTEPSAKGRQTTMVARMQETIWWEAGRSAASRLSFAKQADTPQTVHKLGGRLYMSQSGWLLLQVPNAFLRGAFDALHAPGAELPTRSNGVLNAHITVMRPEEIAELGGPDKIVERGHTQYYTLGPVKELTPLSWGNVSKVWVIEVDSPDLRNLRKSYGLTPLPCTDHEFHITIGIRRKNVLRDNATAKFTVERARNDDRKLSVRSASVVTRSASCLDFVWGDVPAAVAERLQYVLPLVKSARVALVAVREATPDAVLLAYPEEKQAYLYGVSTEGCQAAGLPALLSWPDDTSELVVVKLAGMIGDAFTGAGKLLGGPNPLTNTIVGGLAVGGLGYLGGATIENKFPDRYVERGRLRKTLGAAGVAAGVSLPLWHAYSRYRANLAAGEPASFTKVMTAPIPTTPVQPPAIKAGGLIDFPEWVPSLEYFKAANFDTGINVKPIPVDAFNRAVWNDVHTGGANQNPFGTRSPWGEQQDSLHTPPELAATTTGLLSGIASMHGGAGLLRPSTVIRGFVSAGAGLAAATLAGKTLGVLGGLTPHAQQQLQRTGIWAGVLSSVIPPLFH